MSVEQPVTTGCTSFQLRVLLQYRRVIEIGKWAAIAGWNIQMPDKYLVEDSVNPGGLSTAICANTRGLNGDRAWTASSGGGGMVFPGMAGPGGRQMTPEQMEAAPPSPFTALN